MSIKAVRSATTFVDSNTHGLKAHPRTSFIPQAHGFTDEPPANQQRLKKVYSTVVKPFVRFSHGKHSKGQKDEAPLKPKANGERRRSTWPMMKERKMARRGSLDPLISALSSKRSREKYIHETSRRTSQDILFQINVLQGLLDVEDATELQNTLHSPSGDLKSGLLKIQLRLALETDTLPTALFLRDVECSEREPISGGAYSDVYIGQYKGKKVALKCLRPIFMANPNEQINLKKSLYHELLLWSNLSHPNTLPLLGINEDLFAQRPVIVLPWMKNGNVIQYLNNLKKSGQYGRDVLLAKVHTWMDEILRGLAYLHSEGVIHGDLRGVNILLDDNERVKITDFGLSVISGGTSNQYSSMRGGNERWMAPEIIFPELFNRTSARPTFASDIYSYACVCIELYTGSPPFDSRAMVQRKVYEDVRPEQPQFNDEKMKVSLWAPLNNCLSRDPQKRVSAKDLLTQIAQELTPRFSY